MNLDIESQFCWSVAAYSLSRQAMPVVLLCDIFFAAEKAYGSRIY